MAAVETKVAGYFTGSNLRESGDEDNEEWGTKTIVLQPDELSYALGKKGMTRKKLAKVRVRVRVRAYPNPNANPNPNPNPDPNQVWPYVRGFNEYDGLTTVVAAT